MWPALDFGVGLIKPLLTWAPALLADFSQIAGASARSWYYMPKQPDGTPAEKPPAPSVKVRPPRFLSVGGNSQTPEASKGPTMLSRPRTEQPE
jgi:hypothetical protein